MIQKIGLYLYLHGHLILYILGPWFLQTVNPQVLPCKDTQMDVTHLQCEYSFSYFTEHFWCPR